MTVLLLRLAAPLQAWGDHSRFRHRDTGRYPTKSGVLGLLAAACGRRRTDPIEDLLALRFGVRVDQPGVVLSDFHTAHVNGLTKPPIVTEREYLSDAVFVAGLEGDDRLVEALAECLERPRFPLYLGRRSCPVEGPLVLGTSEVPLVEALEAVPWQAAAHHRRRQSTSLSLRMVVDAPAGAQVVAQAHDEPVSFDPRQRSHTWRAVEERSVLVDNPDGRVSDGGLLDWFSGVGS